MAGSQRDVKNRIGSVRNIQKITRAMEMVAAARLRRAEQRIANLRPYARAVRTMTRRVVEAAERIPDMPLLEENEGVNAVGLLVFTGDRGLAGAFNSQVIRTAMRRAGELRAEGKEVVWYAAGRRGVSSLQFRGQDVRGAYAGFTDRPSYADAKAIADEVSAAYAEKQLARVETVHNHYISPLSQEVRHERLLSLQGMAEVVARAEGEAGDEGSESADAAKRRALWIYEPEPGEILRRLIPDYIEISIFRRLLESTASEHGARMTAMRSASDNAGELIEDLTLEMNRARQAEITQEIMEVVAGAEALG